MHVLGVTEADDATFAAMLQFADSVLGLAEIARRSGRVVDAINELWPLVARLEALAADGFVERESLALLGRARVSLGVALGELLSDEKLATAAKWTGQALIVAERLDDSTFLAHVLAMHGNELRKAGRIGAAIERLRRSVALSSGAHSRASAYAVLARAAGEARRPELFDSAMDGYRRELDEADGTGMLSNRFTFREVLLRGLAATGRASLAARLMDEEQNTAAPVAPQWGVIEQVTVGEILLAIGEREGAEEALLAALAGTETYRPPHQAQRAIRVAARDADVVAQAGRAVLARLSSTLSVAGL